MDKENEELLMILQKQCEDMINTLQFNNKKELIAAGMALCLSEDIEFIQNLSWTNVSKNYILLILRSCLEQVIIFIFLNKRNQIDTHVYEDYLGANIDFNDIRNEDNPIEVLKKLGGERTTYHNNFYNLSSEFENPNDDTSLYNLYRYLADFYHNTYYHRITELLFDNNQTNFNESISKNSFIEAEESISADDQNTINIIIKMILSSFLAEF